MARPLFMLGNRLQVCADYVRDGKIVADIGTDHAYLPVWLLKKEIITYAIAMDLREGPLKSAEMTADRYRVKDKLSLRLSDGLCKLEKDEAQDIVIAGMGAELISEIIIKDIEIVRDNDIQLILQPMRSPEILRSEMLKQGFYIMRETALIENSKVYTVMSMYYDHEASQKYIDDIMYYYMGRLDPDYIESCLYADKVIRVLENKMNGCKISGRIDEAMDIDKLICEIQSFYRGGKRHGYS